jgi:hypothetical protein
MLTYVSGVEFVASRANLVAAAPVSHIDVVSGRVSQSEIPNSPKL